MKNVSLVSYSVITVKLTMVLTFDFAFGKRQREHPHKLSDYIVKERSPRFPRRRSADLCESEIKGPHKCGG